MKEPKRKSSPWFAFYPEDYMGGTRVMTLAARGAFVDLLNHQFLHGSIPADDRTICRIIGAFPDEWEAIKEEVLGKFPEGKNERMEKEIEERDGRRNRAIENGRKGGRPPKEKTQNETQNETQKKPRKNPEVISRLTQNVTQNEPRAKASTSTTTSIDFPTENNISLPSTEEAATYAASSGLMIAPECVEAWHDARTAAGWINAKNQPIQNWQADLRGFSRHWVNNEQQRKQNNGGKRSNQSNQPETKKDWSTDGIKTA